MSFPENYWLISSGIFMVALVFLVIALRYRQKKYLVDNLPTSKVQGVFVGLVEVKGTAEAEKPLRSYLADESVVHYQWRVQEHWRKRERETYRDSKGKTKTRTRTRSGWKTVASDEERIPFYLRDDTGILRILPDGAKVEPKTLFDQTCRRKDPLYYQKGPRRAVANSTHKRRFIEEAVPLHQSLYVVGKAREREDMVAPEIAHDPDARLFLISTRTASQVSRGYALAAWALALVAFLLIVGGQWFLWNEHPAMVEKMRPYSFLFGSAFLVGWFLGWIWIAYNSLVDLRQRMKRAWSLVEIQLKRRSDLIPQIVSIVKGLKDHEKTLQSELAELRTQSAATEPGAEGPDPAGVKPCLLAIREAYPSLKSDETFLQLQQQLSETEQRIALARSYFNEVCTFFNTRLEVIPDRFIAKLGTFSPHPLIVAENFERASVQVDLAP
ncbi:MAG: LemA family protein [Opitutales bacterium]|nr:LemA family protein [Opitutales bacterium]MCH8539283.1 LemA family protein [Opitutales bacterium]